MWSFSYLLLSVNNYQVSLTNKSFCLKIEQKIPVWLFYSALDDEKRLVLGAWTVMQNSVLRS